MGVGQVAVPGTQEAPVPVEDQHGGLALVECDDLAGLGDHHSVVGPTALGAVSLRPSGPVVDPFVGVVSAI